MAYGTCKLTGQQGKLVRSHLLPKAVTRTPTAGEPRVEAGEGMDTPRRRFDSWYDKNLVTRDGEDILAKYDDRGISILRSLGLVWSSDRLLCPPSEFLKPMNPDWHIGQLPYSDTQRKWLRLFFLSLLWRAAATDHIAFAPVILQEDKLERLKEALLHPASDDKMLFPTTLVHLHTRGGWHNNSPTYREEGDGFRFFRFYFDGLIALIHIVPPTSDDLSSLAVGNGPELVFMSRPFEGSHQEERINTLMLETLLNHPETVESLLSGKRKAISGGQP